MKELKKSRAWQYDEIKFFLIFLVVLGHILENYIIYSTPSWDIKYLRFLIYTFHMPLFIFISGLFSKKNIDEKRYSHIGYYIVLYFVVKIINFISSVIQKNIFSINLFSESGVAWYCFAIAAFSIITICIKNKNKTFVFFTALILGLLAGYDNSIGDEFVIRRIITFFPFFFAGYVLDPKKLISKLSKKKYWLLSIVIILLFSLVTYIKIKDIYWITPLLSGRNSYVKLGINMEIGWALRMVYYFLNFTLILSIISIFTILKKPTIFNKFGTRTLAVYSIHYVIVDFLFFGTFNPNKWLPFNSGILIIPIALAITLILSISIFEKPFIWLRKKCLENKS